MREFRTDGKTVVDVILLPHRESLLSFNNWPSWVVINARESSHNMAWEVAIVLMARSRIWESAFGVL